jgi:putative transferase (TIGR04331 family)
VHGSVYGERFWQKALSISILRHITICYETFKTCEAHLDPILHNCNIIDQQNYFIPENFDAHRRFFNDTDFGREQLFSVYCNINLRGKFKSILVPDYKHVHRLYTDTLKDKLNRQLLRLRPSRIYNWGVRKIKKANLGKKISQDGNQPTMAIMGCYFSEQNRERLLRESCGKIEHIELPEFPVLNTTPQWKLRDQLTRSDSSFDHFDEFVFESLRCGMPKLYVEDFQYFYNYIDKYFDQKSLNLNSVLCESWIGSSKHAFAIAVLSKREVRHLSVEHNYISHCYLGSNLKYLAPISDDYITFGWKDPSISNIIPGASLFTWTDIEKRHIKKHKILFILAAPIAYIPEINAAYGNNGAYGVMRTFDMTKRFLSSLSEATLKEIYIRSYPKNPLSEFLVWDQSFILSDFIYRVKFYDDVGVDTSRSLMQHSRLVIVNYLSTAYLESIIANIPTIVFLDIATMHLQEKYTTIFDGLIRVGIFQTNSDDAATFINRIKDYPEIWWNSVEVQSSRKEFLDANFGDLDNMIQYLLAEAQKPYQKLHENS